MKYLEFLIQNGRFLAFGIAAIFFASSGQTIFISIFGGEFRRDFGLTNGDFGFIYMIATIASAFSLIALGRLIDRIDLRLYTALICGAMIGAIFLISSTKTVLMLGYMGAMPAEGIYLISARVGTVYYFLHFLVVLPVVGYLEKTDPIPMSISEPVISGSANLSMAKKDNEKI